MSWLIGAAILGIVLTLAVQGVLGMMRPKPVNTRNAIQGDTLPTIAVQNRRRLITINNAYDVVTVPGGTPYTYKYTLPETANCRMQSPVVSGVTGTNSMTIAPTHPWFPRPGQPVVYRLMCSMPTGESFGDSAVVVAK
jgi:hypothetical protein